MKIWLICYAHPGRYSSDHIFSLQQKTIETADTVGEFDEIIPFRFEHLDFDFVSKNQRIFSQPRGAGYWIWKPHLALKMLNSNEVKNGDIVVYIDSKVNFISSIRPLIEIFNRDKLSIMTFRQIASSKVYTKKDCFVLTNSTEPKYIETTQRVGNFWVFKKDEFSRTFFNLMLEYSQNERIITDLPSQIPNSPEFNEHRHDESLISILAKRFDLYPYKFPCDRYMKIEQAITNGQFTEESYTRYKQINPDDWSITTFKQYPDIVTDEKSTYGGIINY